MRSGWMNALVGGLMGALPGLAAAQTPFNVNPGTDGPQTAAVGGKPTIDVIVLKAALPSVPLRNGGVIQGSESIQLGGRVLVRGVDYQLDLEAGVIYLMRTPRPGESLIASYRYEPSKAKTTANSTAGLPTFRFDIAPGGYNLGSMIMGFGIAERRADGNVVTSNLYGWNNRFQFGQTSIGGLMMVGEKQRVDARSGFEYQDLKDPNDLGREQFIVQGLRSGFMGGSVEVDYQDISKNFTGFAAAQNAGFDAKQTKQFEKERGLTRFGMAMKGLDFGGLKLSNGMRYVDDDGAKIDWRSYGLSYGGFTFDFNSRKIDENFKRFKDLGEEDRGQLAKEVGMTRETYAAAFNSKATKMALNVAEIADPKGASIKRSEYKIDAHNFRFTFGEQEVPKDFTRMGSLLDAEKAMWGRELGLERQWASVEATITKGAGPLKFSQGSIESSEGSFKSRDLDLNVSGWSLTHIDREVSEGFASMNGMQDGERNEHIKAITRMYDPKGFGFSGNDNGWFMHGKGLDRSLTRISGTPFKGWNLIFDNLALDGIEDSGEVSSLALSSGSFDAKYRSVKLGEKFSDLAGMMDFERARLGSVVGLDQEEFGLNLNLGRNKLSLGMMTAETEAGGAERTTLAYSSKDLNISVAQRNVDTEFTNVGQLADPEKDFLNALRGFNQQDIRASWQLTPNLKIETFNFSANDPVLDQNRQFGNQRLIWSPDKTMQVGLVRLDQNQRDPLKVLFANLTEQIHLTKDFGKMGSLKYMTLTRDYEGDQNSLQDSEKRYFSYETKLDEKTTIRTEETSTKFEDGAEEKIRAHALSTEVSKRVGVSVTDVNVDRDGQEHDETKRNYGFWFDLGSGIRFSYGKAQNLNNGKATPQAPNLLNASETALANMAQGIAPDARWAEQDNEAMTYQLASAKPLNVAFLQDVKFNFGMDSAKDRSRWIRENKNVNFSAKLFGTTFGYDFKSQMSPNGKRASDKSFTITTDQSETKPLRASLFYKVRRPLDGDDIMIRNFSVAAKPSKNIEVTHQLLTNPEVARGDAILGSITQANRLNRWKLDLKQNKDLTIGGSFEEIRDQNRPLSRVGGLNVTLNGSTGSPLKLFYGVEQADRSGNRHTTHRYHLQFDQKPGANQSFSVFLGNVSYQHTIAEGIKRDNWTMRLDYQIRF